MVLVMSRSNLQYSSMILAQVLPHNFSSFTMFENYWLLKWIRLRLVLSDCSWWKWLIFFPKNPWRKFCDSIETKSTSFSMLNGPVIKWSVILQWSVIKPTKSWISGCHTTIVASWKSVWGGWTRDYQHWPLRCARSYSDILLIIIILPFRVACDIRAFAYRLESLPYKKMYNKSEISINWTPYSKHPSITFMA